LLTSTVRERCGGISKRYLDFRPKDYNSRGGQRRVSEIIDGVDLSAERAVDCAVPIWRAGHQTVPQ
jgi:hypothetical protein